MNAADARPPRNAGTDTGRGPAIPARGGRAFAWVMLYLGLVAAPLLVLLAGPTPRGGGFLWDFAMALGFGGLAILGLQFVLTARFRRATAPFGIDIIYYFHRYAALGGVALVLAHYLILRVRYPDALGPVNLAAAPWPMTAGRIALVLFGVLIVTSLLRKQLRWEYDYWRIGHAAMAVAALALAIAHILGVGHYTAGTWRGFVWGSYSILWLLVVGYIRVLRPWGLKRRPYRVVAVTPERGAAWTVTVDPEGHDGLRFRAGQFAWLTLGTSPFRAREHPFSFSSSAAAAPRLQFTIKELGDFTRTIRDVKPGTIAYVDGPHGVFTVEEHARVPGLALVAGGVGIAPIMSVLRTLADQGESRPLHLVYGNRRWDNVLFREELDGLRTRLALTVTHVLQEPPAGWTGPTGVLSADVLGKVIPEVERAYVFLVCGPKPMSAAVQRTLHGWGIPLRRIRTELFDMA